MSFTDEDILLNQLMEETFSESSSPQEMTSYDVLYYNSIKCYQVKIDGQTFTFPSNWGPFMRIHERVGDGLILENDLESFNSIFSSLVGKEVKAAFIFKGTETYLIFVPKKMEINLKDLHSLIHDQSCFKLAA